MGFYEYVGNMHMHTPYSDGNLYHADIARVAIGAGLDFIIVTDHNVLVKDVEGYYSDGSGRHVLLLTGQEIHNRTQHPESNHMLVIGADRDLVDHSYDPQELIDAVREAGGMCFIAHPYDPDAPVINEGPIRWTAWDAEGYTGVEIWNWMSAFKKHLTSRSLAIKMIYNSDHGVTAPPEEALRRWDELLAEGRRVVGVAGSDAHGSRFKIGPFEREVFSYGFLFRRVNIHVLATRPLSGKWEEDAALIYEAMREGRVFIADHSVGDPRGFRFSGFGQKIGATMGGEVKLGHGATLQVIVPRPALIRIILNGKVIAEEPSGDALSYTADRAGAYRAEVWLRRKGGLRGWIFSNPIYVVD